jgi:hypothetical protein
LKDFLNCFDSGHQFFKLDEFSLREFLPALRGWRAITEAEEEFADFVERETNFARALKGGETIEGGIVVSSLATDALRGRQDADLFVVADCGGAQADLSRYVGDRHQWHVRILGQLGFRLTPNFI